MKNLFQIICASLFLMCAAGSFGAANDGVNPALRPPKGATVALVVFEDLQCPQCKRMAPILEQASKPAVT